MKMLKSKKLLGFTLIELLIVIAIIGILAVAFLPSLLGAPAKGRDAQRMTTVQKVENFLVTQILANKTLPAMACINPAGAALTIGALITANVASFGGKFPLDPQSTNEATGAVNVCKGQYGYIKFAAAGHKYTAAVYVHVENVENANIKCSDVKDVVAPALVTTTLAAADVGCYIALIQ